MTSQLPSSLLNSRCVYFLLNRALVAVVGQLLCTFRVDATGKFVIVIGVCVCVRTGFID